ncbi:MAG: hypothetical protein HC850_07675 [Rhodomicrobium sp.]|nr:hypothetical protein [Rhodomicrobium sp.]
MRLYRAQYEAFRRARVEYDRKAAAYWSLIDDKRAKRRKKRAAGKRIELDDYVLDQPPVYSGPPEPAMPPALAQKKIAKKKPKTRGLPVVADFLRYAKKHFNFAPERPASEMEYKLAYARTAVAAGIGKDQGVRIYGFEAGGNGEYDVQAGLESKKKGAKPISTALGYNQLLVANTIGLLSAHGGDFIAALEARAANAEGNRRKSLEDKIAKLRRMVKFARSFPYRWATHVRVAGSTKGWALHAVILDVDIGPLMQTQKLVNSIKFAKRNGYGGRLSAAELEMLNLTGDGNGFDMITIPPEMRAKVPTSNFFQRGGYERNPVASRNNVVSALLAATDRKMDYHAGLDGGKQMAAAFEEALAAKRADLGSASAGQ